LSLPHGLFAILVESLEDERIQIDNMIAVLARRPQPKLPAIERCIEAVTEVRFLFHLSPDDADDGQGARSIENRRRNFSMTTCSRLRRVVEAVIPPDMQTATDQLNFRNDWLLVFMDETGHETFGGDQPYFGVGGCAILGLHHAAVSEQWREVRRAINGDPDAPLHAADLEYSEKNFAVLSQFFASRAFARFGVGVTSKTNFNVDMHAMTPVMGMLKRHIARIVEHSPCSTVALIFESSQRGDQLVQQHFGELGLIEEGRPVPTEHCFMPKSAGEPALEIADFVASAAGSQARFYHRGKAGSFAKDYQAVFHQHPPPYSQFFHIEEVGGSRENNEAWIQGSRRAE
jgi:hypothetical protein